MGSSLRDPETGRRVAPPSTLRPMTIQVHALVGGMTVRDAIEKAILRLAVAGVHRMEFIGAYDPKMVAEAQAAAEQQGVRVHAGVRS